MKQLSLKIQSFILLGLFVLSLLIYWNEHRRASDFDLGGEFLKGMNPSSIYKFVMKNDKNQQMVFKRVGEGFVMESLYSYPAHHGRLNDLLFELSKIMIQAKVSDSSGPQARYGVATDKGKMTFELYDAKDKLMVKFYIGEEYKPLGRYIRKEGDDTTYVTQGNIDIIFDEERYVQKTIINFENRLVTSVIGKDYKIDRSFEMKKDDKGNEREEEIVKFDNPATDKKVNDNETYGFIHNLSNIAFDKVFVTGSPEIAGLDFDPNFLTIKLNNGRSYVFKGAVKDKFLYFTVSNKLDNVDGISLKKDADATEIKKADDYFKLQKEMDDFNLFHQTWVYKMLENKSLILTRVKEDFYQKPPKEELPLRP